MQHVGRTDDSRYLRVSWIEVLVFQQSPKIEVLKLFKKIQGNLALKSKY